MPRSISDDHILSAARDVITRLGYTAATTRKIADAAGINEVTLFRRFGSKEQLMQRIVQEEIQRFEKAHIVYTGDLQADLEQVMDFYARLVAERGPVMLMMISEIPRHPELNRSAAMPLHVIEQVEAMIVRYQQEGQLQPEPPRQTLLALVGPLFLAQSLMILGIQPPSSEAQPFFDPKFWVKRFLSGRGGASHTL